MPSNISATASGGAIGIAVIPMAPAFVTSATSSGVQIAPIGASWIGTSQPTSPVKRWHRRRATSYPSVFSGWRPSTWPMNGGWML